MALEQPEALGARVELQGELAHKLLNLIAATSSYVGLFRDTDLDSEQTEMLDEMNEVLDSAVFLCRRMEKLLLEGP